MFVANVVFPDPPLGFATRIERMGGPPYSEAQRMSIAGAVIPPSARAAGENEKLDPGRTLAKGSVDTDARGPELLAR